MMDGNLGQAPLIMLNPQSTAADVGAMRPGRGGPDSPQEMS